MSSTAERDPLMYMMRHELEVWQGNWIWYLIMGIVLVIIGTVAIGSTFIATLATVTVLSVLLVIGGLVQTVGAFFARKWSGFFMLLLTGILYLIAGVVCFEHPAEAAVDLTLLIAFFLIAGGLFRIIASIAIRFPNWGWLLASGVITLWLGILIWRQWPSSGYFIIGLFVGIEMIFTGWTWIIFSLAIRGLPRLKA
jgi:uncharacterized membrane protein HdeD (DUF308 family)